MTTKLLQDIDRFFSVYRDRIDDLLHPLSPASKTELEEELDLLRISVRNRIQEEIK